MQVPIHHTGPGTTTASVTITPKTFSGFPGQTATLRGRGTAKVYALLLTGPADSAVVAVTLPASQAVSGDRILGRRFLSP